MIREASPPPGRAALRIMKCGCGGEPRADSGYGERMARRKPADSAVPIGLQVSEADAAGIDQVLARPEFAGWTRAEWCREIVRTALRYYLGSPVPAGRQPAPVAASAGPPAAAGAGAAAPALPAVSEPDPGGQEAPGPPAPADCPHPPSARDYERGVCAVCGAVIWD